MKLKVLEEIKQQLPTQCVSKGKTNFFRQSIIRGFSLFVGDLGK
jgi:hypothetical protein